MTRLILLFVVLWAMNPNAQAQETPPATAPAAPATDAPTTTPQLTKAPVLQRFVEAVYPPEAAQAGTTASVVLSIDIGADGKVLRAEVTQSAGASFDEAARAAVLQFEFQPAEVDGVPSAIRVDYRYDFVLRPASPPPVEEGAKTGRICLEGVVLERGVKKPVAGAVVTALRDGKTVGPVEADEQGRFSLADLEPGAWKLQLRSGGFTPYETVEEVRSGEVLQAKYYLRRISTGTYEVTVRARRDTKEVSRRTVTAAEIQKLPGTSGDAIRVVQNLPGVARTPYGLGPLVVRGGRPGDTRTYIDGQLVPVLFHFGGLTSVINSEFLDSLDFQAGNFPVRYGRSLAGTVDVQTRDGSRERPRGYASVSLTEASAFVEGPVGAHGSLMASVRRSYIDALLPVILDLTGSGGVSFRVAPRYWDYQVKGTYTRGKDTFSLMFFGSDDALSLGLDNPSRATLESSGNLSTRIGFTRLTGRWTRKLAPALDHRLTWTVGNDKTSTEIGGAISLDFDVDSLALREDLTWKPSPALSVRGGLDVLRGSYAYSVLGPPAPRPGEVFDPSFRDRLQSASELGAGWQPAAWLESTWKPLEWLTLVPGLRLDADTVIRRAWADPRLSIFLGSEQLAFKAAVGKYAQPPTPDKLTRLFGNPDLNEESSVQYAAGVEWRPTALWECDLQLYFKNVYDQATRGTELSAAEARALLGDQPIVSGGQAQAAGVELLLRRLPGRGPFGWIAVSVGDARQRSAPDLPWIPAPLAQRYNVVGLVSYRLPGDVDVGLRGRWTDGNPKTEILGAIYDTDADRFLPLPSSERRSSRRPDYIQLDLRIDRRWTYEKWVLDGFVDILNVTNRANVEGERYNFDYTVQRPLWGLPIIPSFGLRGEY